MECPLCGGQVTQEEEGDALRIYCGSCGWGAGNDSPGDGATADDTALASWGLLALLWGAGMAVVIGPYFLLRSGVPALFDVGLPGGEEAYARFVNGLNSWYGFVMAIYLAAAGVFAPTYDRENVGWLGGMIDNPFSYQDDFERTKRTVVFILLPGKVVWAAVKGTWYKIRG